MKKIFLFLLTLNFIAYSQEFNATVTVNYESLPGQYKENLVTFKQSIEDYINKNRWTELNFGEQKIPISFSIFFRSASSSNKYSAQVVITSQREIYKSDKLSPILRVRDSDWDFIYEKNQVLNFNPNAFDPLMSFINYYCYLVLGLYMDSYVEPKEATGGTAYFTKALSIASQGMSSSSPIGWSKGDGSYDRLGVVTEILNEKFQNFRKAYFDYHYNGLDLYSEDPGETIKMINNLIRAVEIIRTQVFSRSIFLKVFFDTKYTEICEYLVKSKDKEIFERLKKVDPAHISTYDEYKKK